MEFEVNVHLALLLRDDVEEGEEEVAPLPLDQLPPEVLGQVPGEQVKEKSKYDLILTSSGRSCRSSAKSSSHSTTCPRCFRVCFLLFSLKLSICAATHTGRQ